MSTSKKAWIVTLDCRGSAPRAKFGSFLWNNTYGRYVWKGELATTMGQLAELFTQAATFLRGQSNYYLELSAVEVEVSEAPSTNIQAPENIQASSSEPEPEEGDETLSSAAFKVPDFSPPPGALIREQLDATEELLRPKKKLADLTPVGT